MGTDPSELQARLTPEQFRITQLSGTEAPFTGPWLDEHREGTYRCIVCNHPLFSSTTKFDSGSGWPSFTDPLDDGSVTDHDDQTHGMVRTETRCANCGAHLGHVFPDGPGDSGLRYCINGAALDLETT